MSRQPVVTPRLEVRPPVEADRDRFVHLFRDPGFMIYSSGVLGLRAAHDRFDRMCAVADEMPFAKQPVVERASGEILGYTGVDYFPYRNQIRLEWGYRLVPEVRNRGYATEASLALLAKAREEFAGEVLAIIDPTNEQSQRVIRKLGFSYWEQSSVEGEMRNIYRLTIQQAQPR